MSEDWYDKRKKSPSPITMDRQEIILIFNILVHLEPTGPNHVVGTNTDPPTKILLVSELNNVELKDYSCLLETIANISSSMECTAECVRNPECMALSHNSNGDCLLHKGMLTIDDGGNSVNGWKHYTIDFQNCPVANGFKYARKMGVCYHVSSILFTDLSPAVDYCKQLGSEIMVMETERKRNKIINILNNRVSASVQKVLLAFSCSLDGGCLWTNGDIVISGLELFDNGEPECGPMLGCCYEMRRNSAWWWGGFWCGSSTPEDRAHALCGFVED